MKGLVGFAKRSACAPVTVTVNWWWQWCVACANCINWWRECAHHVPRFDPAGSKRLGGCAYAYAYCGCYGEEGSMHTVTKWVGANLVGTLFHSATFSSRICDGAAMVAMGVMAVI